MEGYHTGSATTLQGARLSRWLFGWLLLMLTACPAAERRPDGDPSAQSGEFLVGRWEEPDGAVFEFAKVDGKVRAVSVVDDDGERFEVKSLEYVDGRWQLTYSVPSTGYVVTLHFQAAPVGSAEVAYDWVNSAKESGREALTRLLE